MCEFLVAQTPERSAGGGQPEPGNLVVPAAAQALEDSGLFAVHGDEFPAEITQRLFHEPMPADNALLICLRYALAGLERAEERLKRRKAADAIYDYRWLVERRKLRQRARPAQYGRSLREILRTERMTACYILRFPATCLLDQQIDVLICRNTKQREPIRACTDDVKRLTAYGTGAAEHRNKLPSHTSPALSIFQTTGE